MNAQDAAKLQAFPAPLTLSAQEKKVWNAVIVACPLAVFTEADKRLLVRYCKSDSMLDALNAKRAELTRAELAKLARLISMQRQIRLALRFKELARKEARSAAPEGHAGAHSIVRRGRRNDVLRDDRNRPSASSPVPASNLDAVSGLLDRGQQKVMGEP